MTKTKAKTTKPSRKPHGPPRAATAATHLEWRDKELAAKTELRSQARDIAPLPEVVDPDRRNRATDALRVFCETYFPEQFTLGWSEDHLRVLEQIERAVKNGGLFAMAMPRGSGKTTISECAAVWSLLCGYRSFIVLIGASEKHATEIMESLKTELETNDLLAEDFPEAIHAIRKLDGIAHRAGGQLYQGERTHIGWTADELILPDLVPEDWKDDKVLRRYVDKKGRARCSGAIVRVAGITGRIRGMKFKRPDGRASRPDFVIVDDPQTDDSAKSPSQCQYRESVLSGAILGLAGPGKKIAGVMPCTVIRAGDMADRMLDRQLHPEWNGERTKMVYAWPTAEALWDQYSQMRADGMRSGDQGKAATAFYAAHRAEMDAGAKVAWESRFNPDEHSAIQHVMNLRLERGDSAFFAEYQNDPIPDESGPKAGDLTPDVIAARTNGLQRWCIPTAAHHLTAFIDVQGKALYYTVCAWEDDFTGAVVDYGAWPDQRIPYYTLRDLRRTMAQAFPNAGLEGQILGALKALVAELTARIWQRDDGTKASLDRILIDANWGTSTEVVYEFCRRDEHAAILLPSHGRFLGASGKPLSEWQRRRGDRVGHHWKIPVAQGRQVRHMLIDTNFWKTFLVERFATAMGDPGALTIYGSGKDSGAHRLFAEQCCAEYRIPVTGRGRTVDEWKLRPEGFDNHWWDGLVGCAAAASMLGVSIGAGDQQAPRRARMKLSDRGTRSDAALLGAIVHPDRAANPPPAPATPPAQASRPAPGRMRLSDLRKNR
jgi:hypothetical protein